MRTLFLSSVFCLLSSVLAGCSTPGNRATADAIQREMDAAVQASVQPSKAEAGRDGLLSPLAMSMPKVGSKPLDTRFDLTVSNTSVNQVFTAIVSGTRYSMLLHPEVRGSISLNLKDVTVFEALEAIREMYGYDYKVDGTRIYILPWTLQTRIFQVNYLTGSRAGTSSLRVTSGSVSDSNTGSTAGTAGTTTTASTTRSVDSSKVTTTSSADFWTELSQSLQAIVGSERGRSLVISPMSGVIVVRAMPDELKNVAAYLKASQISIERQVNLEAKIVEVQLNDSFQSGINWAAFRNSPTNHHVSLGQISPGASLSPTGSITNGLLTSTPGSSLDLGTAAKGSLI